jgi:hypothetical protein
MSTGTSTALPGMAASGPSTSTSVAPPNAGDATDAGVDDRIRKAVAAGQLTAAEWSDLEHWAFWRTLHGDCQNKVCPDAVGKEHSGHWGYDSAGRIPVLVKAGDAPVVDAKVTLHDASQKVVWEAHTDHTGHAELFASMFGGAAATPYSVEAVSGGNSVSAQQVKPGDPALTLNLPAASAPPPSLDLMFVIDTTGSMSDELSYVQAELEDVIQQVRDKIGSQLSLRVSVNFYRDQGDPYVVLPFAFTDNIADSVAELAKQSAGGGGDIPEAVEEALDDAINQHDWRAQATARLLFLVLDAPPHYDDARLAVMHRVTQEAAALGVQLMPVAASGTDKSTEFLLRNLAVATNGRYLFLTDDSGIGNSHEAPTIGAYQVELLNELLVRVISERL